MKSSNGFKKFYMNYSAYVVFTYKNKQYIRRLYTENKIRFNNQLVSLDENDIY